MNNDIIFLPSQDDIVSGVTIGRARRAVHAGAALWGAQNLPDAVFKKFFWGRRGPFGILARGPTATLLRHWILYRNGCMY